MASATAKRQILIVDDEAHVREIVKTCLETLGGWNTISAVSGEEGLLKAMVHRPDAIVLDVMMPEMNGLDFLQRLRTNPVTQSIPVVILSAEADRLEPGCFTGLAITGIIPKPFNPITLHQQIAQILAWESC